MMRPIMRAVAVLSLAASPAAAQVIRPSQAGAVMQWVANTKIELSYHRPVARGRELFGKLVPYGKVWSPSADSAAVFTISTPISVNGSMLPAGSYSIWTIPGPAEWTVMFSSVAVVHHMFYPEGKDVIRVKAIPRQGDRLETLTFYFPMVDADSAEMALHWGNTVVPLKIKSKP
jgi:Protein of unknown function (DUF2911)